MPPTECGAFQKTSTTIQFFFGVRAPHGTVERQSSAGNGRLEWHRPGGRPRVGGGRHEGRGFGAARRPLAELGDELGGETIVAPADLRDEAAILSVFERIRSAWGGVDVLVNSGGLGRSAPLLEGPVEAWREMLQVNVLGISICTKLAVEDMRRRGDCGHVFHISSMSAHRVPGGSGMYAASKFAVRALTEALRKELRHAGSKSA